MQQPTSSPLRYVVDLVRDKLNDRIFGNCHFFVNSVKFIASVLQKTNIKPDDVKIVCANGIDNERKLKGYHIGKPSDPPCKINFYTSTCFEGCDIFDEQGKTYVVSNGKNPNTLYDISTLFVQIIGRIRDSAYRDTVVQIVANTGYKGDVSYADYKSIEEGEYKISQKAVGEYNSQDKRLRKERVLRLGKEHFMDRFIRVNEEYEFVLDYNLLNKKLLDYKLKTEIYNKSFSLITAYRDNGLNAKCLTRKSYSDRLKANGATRIKFRDTMDEYHELVTTQNLGNNTERIAVIKLKYPFISEAYYKLGMERIRELNYSVTLIKRELVKISDMPSVKKIIELVVKRIGYQNPVELKVAKNCLQHVYEILNIRRKATASRLKDYFIVHEFQKTVGGRIVKYMELVREKTMLPK